ncbi:hypothetical protein ABGN05_09160 [Aquibium sp. LZ166]|uniref:Antitoxin FitA-like ribbon-helix-helix domain-containing protein n=1 Tax=Aquibium pacificus TaxID=3153579 RepID=A0ABV3SGE4_9HYPH
MASLHVRNVDEEIVRKLKERAERNGRSAEAEHRAILNAALVWDAAPETDVAEWKRRAADFRAGLEGRVLTPSEVLLHESRDER